MTSQTRPAYGSPDTTSPPVALVTGGSLGLGRALTLELASRGWQVIVDARDGSRLRDVVTGASRDGAGQSGAGQSGAGPSGAGRNSAGGRISAVPGDVTDPAHRAELVAAVHRAGRLDLLVSNASVLGPSPQPSLADYPLDALREVYAVNTFAPLALWQGLLPDLRRSAGVVVHVSSDAAVEAYPGWGGYGSAKAALDQLTAVIGAENPDLAVYALDPGDMATDLHQQAFPGEDISDRPAPSTVVPAFLALLDSRPPNGRYRAADLLAAAAVTR